MRKHERDAFKLSWNVDACCEIDTLDDDNILSNKINWKEFNFHTRVNNWIKRQTDETNQMHPK